MFAGVRGRGGYGMGELAVAKVVMEWEEDLPQSILQVLKRREWAAIPVMDTELVEVKAVMAWEEALPALTLQVMELGEWVVAETKTVMEWEEALPKFIPLVTALLEWVALTVVDTEPTEPNLVMKWKEVHGKALPLEMADQEHPMAHGKITISTQ